MVSEPGVQHKRRRQLPVQLAEDRICLRPLLRHRQGWGQPRAGCPSGVSPELAEVNGKEEIAQPYRHVLLVDSVSFPPPSLVPSVFLPDVVKYRELDERRSQWRDQKHLPVRSPPGSVPPTTTPGIDVSGAE